MHRLEIYFECRVSRTSWLIQCWVERKRRIVDVCFDEQWKMGNDVKGEIKSYLLYILSLRYLLNIQMSMSSRAIRYVSLDQGSEETGDNNSGVLI